MTLDGFFKTFLRLKRRKEEQQHWEYQDTGPGRCQRGQMRVYSLRFMFLCGFKVYHRRSLGKGPCFINLQMSSAIDGKGRPWVQLG